MIKISRTCAVVMIILSILCCIGGIAFSKLAVANRGVKVTSGYMKDGAYVVNDVGVIGANKEKEEKSETISIVFYALSGILLLSGIGCIVYAQKIKNTDTVRQHGIILEKENGTYVSVIVEFDDNSRKKLLVEPSLIVTQGDRGMVGYKSNLLVEFNKE